MDRFKKIPFMGLILLIGAFLALVIGEGALSVAMVVLVNIVWYDKRLSELERFHSFQETLNILRAECTDLQVAHAKVVEACLADHNERLTKLEERLQELGAL